MPQKNDRTEPRSAIVVPDVIEGVSVDVGATSDDYEASGYVPWVPQIGERVIIRADRSCGYCVSTRDAEDGQIGVLDAISPPWAVSNISDDLLSREHKYWVLWDDESTREATGGPISHFKASELEPLAAYTERRS